MICGYLQQNPGVRFVLSETRRKYQTLSYMDYSIQKSILSVCCLAPAPPVDEVLADGTDILFIHKHFTIQQYKTIQHIFSRNGSGKQIPRGPCTHLYDRQTIWMDKTNARSLSWVYFLSQTPCGISPAAVSTNSVHTSSPRE